MARALGVLAGLVGLLLGAEAARGQDGPLVGEVAAVVHTDGASLAAWQDASGRVVVLADALPAGRTQTVELDERCPLQAVSRRLVGLLCPGARPTLFDVLTREEREVEGLGEARDAVGTGPDVVLSGLGDRWLRLTGPDDTVLLDFLRGRTLSDLTVGRREVVDLNAKSAKRRLCAPLRVPVGDGMPAAAVSRPPYLLARPEGGELALRRCGRKDTTFLTRSDDAPFALSARFAAWATGATVRVRDLSSGDTTSWRTPRGAHVEALQTTDRRLFVATEAADGEPATYVLEPQG